MKNTRSIFLLLIIFSLLAAGTLAQTAAELASIRAEVAAINKNVKNYQKTVKDVDGISGEGTEATYYLSGKGLKKISANIYGETFRATVEIYYSGEEPVFAYQVEKRYDKHIMEKGFKVISTKEKRFYYSGGELIKVMVGKRTITEGEDYDREKTEMKELADKLKAALTGEAR
jgi:cell division protein FtsL